MKTGFYLNISNVLYNYRFNYSLALVTCILVTPPKVFDRPATLINGISCLETYLQLTLINRHIISLLIHQSN